jgi:MjaII restriction endonuclease.
MNAADRKTMVKNVLKESLRRKFRNYRPETGNMPFHYRLLGKDRMALFSFIQSLNTTFGTSIYEPVAVALAKERFKKAISQAKPHDQISSNAHRQIQRIMDGLITASRSPDKAAEIEEIRSVCREGDFSKVRLTKVDIWLESRGGELFLIDLKTVKPNIGDFQKFKRTLLEWVAAELAKDPAAKINTLIGIPYNPYEPEPYKRWTMRGIFDMPKEILVAEELWNFIGGEGTYQELLDSFEAAGIELRPEIDEYFARFR